MRNEFLDDKLRELHLTQVPLTVLQADDLTYTAAVLQPQGVVTATNSGIQNADRVLASAKHSQFVRTIFDLGVDLAIAPEYSCPWEALLQSIDSRTLPAPGQLWVLGCESITPDRMNDLANTNRSARWVIADTEPTGSKRFLDPLCYILWAENADAGRELVVAVQFKGQPMSDHGHNVERDYMVKGRDRFIIRNDNDSIFLTSLICSDSLNFVYTQLPSHNHTPYLILHPQLNRKPRYNAFKEYRRDAYLRNDIQEFICVNWARGFQLPHGGPSEFGGSAYYLKTNALPPQDHRLNEDHQNGLYYTIVPENQSHIFFFNYCEGVFQFRATKASQAAAAMRVLQNRTGPEMIRMFAWDGAGQRWSAVPQADDGFGTLCNAVNVHLAPISGGAMTTLDKERLLALCSGSFTRSAGASWTSPSRLESFYVKEDEIIGRLTFAQDPDAAAHDRRFRALSDFDRLRNSIINSAANFPPSMDHFAGNCSISYPIDNRHEFNLLGNDGEKATVAFVGNSSPQKLNQTYDLLYDILDDSNDHIRDDQRRRLVVWYERQGNILKKWDARSEVDKDLSPDAVSIAKVVE
jgi:hypothetical protein